MGPKYIPKRKENRNIDLLPLSMSKDIQVIRLPPSVIYVDENQTVAHRSINLQGWNPTNEVIELIRMLSIDELLLDDSREITNEGIAYLSSINSLRSLSLRYCQKLTKDCFVHIPTHLTELNMSDCVWVEDSGIRHILKSCLMLNKLSISKCKYVSDFALAIFSEIPRPCITSLNVSYCTKITDVGLLALFTRCSKLCTLLAEGLPLLEGLNLQLLPRMNNVLETLDLSRNHNLHFMTIPSIVKVFATKLISLNLSECIDINDETLIALGRYCLKLEVLKLSSCSLISDIGIKRLVQLDIVSNSNHAEFNEEISTSNGCKRLRVLDLAGCFQITNVGIFSISTSCGNLETINLSGLRRVNGEGLRSLFKNCKRLNSLNICGILVKSTATSKGFFSMPTIDRFALAAIFSGSLTEINLANTKCDVNFLSKCILQRGQQLKEIDFCGIANDAVCYSIGASCKEVQTLRLSKSRYFSERSFLCIPRCCTNLRILDIESCEQITDMTLKALSECCLKLERLSVAGNWQISDEGLSLLFKTCKMISFLNARRCPEVSQRNLCAIAHSSRIVEISDSALIPKPRNIVFHYKKELLRSKAATKITRWIRGCIKRQQTAIINMKHYIVKIEKQRNCAKKIQQWFRRCKLDHIRQKYELLHNNLRKVKIEVMLRLLRNYSLLIILLKNHTRRWKATRLYYTIKQSEECRRRAVVASTCIQRVWRGYIGRMYAKKHKILWNESKNRSNLSAVSIQKVARGFLAKKYFVDMKHDVCKQVQEVTFIFDDQIWSSIQISRCVRGLIGRQAMLNIVRIRQEEEIYRDQCATVIQRSYRAFLAKVALFRQLFKGALAIQKIFRGYRGREEGRALIYQRSYVNHPVILILWPRAIFTRDFAIAWKAKFDNGIKIAIWFQKAYRAFVGRVSCNVVHACQKQVQFDRDTAAKTIQRCCVRFNISVRKQRIKQYLALRGKCATKIQASWRMWKAKVFVLSVAMARTKSTRACVLLSTFEGQSNWKFRMVQCGALISIVSFYRRSLNSRNWISPSQIRYMSNNATIVQALFRGYIGRRYCKRYRQRLVRATEIIQRCWREKLARKKWREIIENRSRQRLCQEEEERATRLSKKAANHFAIDAVERDSNHVIVLQGWYRTLAKRQIFNQARSNLKKGNKIRAHEKLSQMVKRSSENVVFESHIWQDCDKKKEQLLKTSDEEWTALEKELNELRLACIHEQSIYYELTHEYRKLSADQQLWLNVRRKLASEIESVKEKINPFAVRSKTLTLESSRVQLSNKQMQEEIVRLNEALRSFHDLVKGILPYDPLLYQGDIESLLQRLEPQWKCTPMQLREKIETMLNKNLNHLDESNNSVPISKQK